MKTWLKKFFKGTSIACQILIVVGVVFIAFKVVIMLLIIGITWLATVTPPITNNIIIMLCIFFVVVFGLIWST